MSELVDGLKRIEELLSQRPLGDGKIRIQGERQVEAWGLAMQLIPKAESSLPSPAVVEAVRRVQKIASRWMYENPLTPSTNTDEIAWRTVESWLLEAKGGAG